MRAQKNYIPLVPSAIFDTDEKYFGFLNDLVTQTNYLSLTPYAAMYIGGNEMMKKKIFHDFLVETQRRLAHKRG